MFLTDLIKKRKNIINQESQGINLALHLINEFEDRTFTFKGLTNSYFGIRREELIKLRILEGTYVMTMLTKTSPGGVHNSKGILKSSKPI